MRTPALVVLAWGVWLAGAQVAGAADDQPSPAPSPQLAAEGKALYGQFCRNCHGVNMVNPGTSSFDLRKFPPDEHARFVNSVTHGKNTMPAWGDILKPEEIEALWAYVRTGGKT
ncbi:MAG: cytochrome c [Acetobacteraceae bacterium]|nr:cytochrome c [Acetobacteraceae bacterium]MBV8524077.1 cytochrome c [Acetobacteraceae bacterium]MBV8589420.1 cytochrome c [Acetobacteraceae bacterium]